MRFISPLRYPGGKAKLAPFFHNLISKNDLYDYEYVEPYAGGAGVALDLLSKKFVKKIHLNDLDYSVYSFWHSILNHPDKFCEEIRRTPVSLDEWEEQKEIVSKPNNHNIFEVGFATFYLNRTNRSGIINGGVIGGKSQEGKWKIDARFNKENLIKRIKFISLYSSQIEIYNKDAAQFLQETISSINDKSLIYLDPPYYEKGSKLYENHYLHDDHLEISNIIDEVKKYWVISYDNKDPINNMYEGYDRLFYDLHYSAQKKYFGSEVIILDPRLTFPNIEEINIIKNPTRISAN